MHIYLFTVFSVLVLREVEGWGTSAKYAVNCPERCNVDLCGTQRCRRTVLDDCGCCQVCAAGRGEHCYRTVSGMHGVKCGPGLFCEFYKDEDDYGDEYGICKDCTFGTYGVECRKTCSCKAGGICDRITGACLSFKFLTKMASAQASGQKAQPLAGNEGSGDISTSVNGDLLKEKSSTPKWLNPR
ncbi:hypothetical protein COCON_G00171210 [Conger conger]|uniref:IGFBP N-terminal domain-containing protein n=1 Tax=Conger conger TaxID=82655 RepID=A0A9Q1D7X0_CONCO|nr:endothelial cell-specific molecule 1 [Conger conger]KAJ8261398.1 hypothetical protein COCON_G00171210 [Conger conger]